MLRKCHDNLPSTLSYFLWTSADFILKVLRDKQVWGCQKIKDSSSGDHEYPQQSS